MKHNLKVSSFIVSFCCWLIKGLGIVILFLVLAIFIGEGPPNPFKFTARQLLLMVLFLAAWVGLVLALWRQLLGGVVILVSVATFTIVAGVHKNWLFYAFWLLGLLNIFCWWLKGLQGDKK